MVTIKTKKQKLTASLTPKGGFAGEHYKHFGIIPRIAKSIYGVEPESVKEVWVSQHPDQSLPSKRITPQPDYWGWWDIECEEWVHIYPKRFLLNMAFPAGIEANELAGKGKAFRLIISDDSKPQKITITRYQITFTGLDFLRDWDSIKLSLLDGGLEVKEGGLRSNVTPLSCEGCNSRQAKTNIPPEFEGVFYPSEGFGDGFEVEQESIFINQK